MKRKNYKVKKVLDEDGRVRLEFEKYNEKVNGKYTFVGVFRTYIDDVTKEWNKDTQQKYFSEYNELLFPLLNNNKAIEEYTKEELLKIVDEMCTKYERTRHKDVILTRREHYRRLISVVTAVGAEKCGYIDQFAKEKPQTPQIDSAEAIARRHSKTRRSLTPTEELEIYDRIIDGKAKEDGEKIGLAIMYCIGLRNEEACGLNYGDIVKIEYQPEFDIACIVSSTKGGSNERKAGGKTYNSPRQIPLPDALSSLIRERRAYLEDLLKQGKLDCVGVNCRYSDIDELPIVCKGQKYGQRCCSADITKAAKQLFQEINMDENIMKEIEDEISQREVGDFDEREPTAYLLRRNFATHLIKLGYDDGTCSYLMGHKNEGVGDVKSRYTNTDKLYEIYCRMNQHAVVGEKQDRIIEILGQSNICEWPATANRSTIFTTLGNKQVTVKRMIKAIGVEVLKIKIIMPIHEVDSLKVSVIQFTSKKPDGINIISDYYGLYENKRNKRLEQSKNS
jgi:integrase